MSELMRRATPGVALAGAALATVWLFDPALHAEARTAAAASMTDSETAEDPGAAADAPTDDGSSTDAEEPAHAAQEPAPTAADCSDTTSVTGDPAMTRWGPVQVRMDFAEDGTVCGVQAITYPDADRRSAAINSMAIPYLDSQAAEVGVEFDSVSGATYTSEAYRESMQSILDQQ